MSGLFILFQLVSLISTFVFIDLCQYSMFHIWLANVNSVFCPNSSICSAYLSLKLWAVYTKYNSTFTTFYFIDAQCVVQVIFRLFFFLSIYYITNYTLYQEASAEIKVTNKFLHSEVITNILWCKIEIEKIPNFYF